MVFNFSKSFSGEFFHCFRSGNSCACAQLLLIPRRRHIELIICTHVVLAHDALNLGDGLSACEALACLLTCELLGGVDL